MTPVSTGGDLGPLVRQWLNWLEQPCTITNHTPHSRKDCRSAREIALKGCVVLERPEEA